MTAETQENLCDGLFVPFLGLPTKLASPKQLPSLFIFLLFLVIKIFIKKKIDDQHQIPQILSLSSYTANKIIIKY